MKQEKITKALIESSLRCNHLITKTLEGVDFEKNEFLQEQEKVLILHTARCKNLLESKYSLCKIENFSDIANLKKAEKHFIAFNVNIKNQNIDLTLDAIIINKFSARKILIEPIFFSTRRKLDSIERSMAIIQSYLVQESQNFHISKCSVFLLGADSPERINTSIRVFEKKVITLLKDVFNNKREKTFAVQIPFCKQCPFEMVCQKELKSRDDLSLLGGLSKNEIKASQAKGIFTMTQLSYSYRPRKRPESAKPKFYASLRAMAIRESKIYITKKPVVSTDKVDVFVDVEGIPDIDLYYLIGVHIRTSVETKKYSFWANTRDDERKIWIEFLQLIKQTNNYTLFHYGSYEKTFFDKMRKRYRLNEDESQVFETMKSRLVNVISLIYGQIYFPTLSNGLKDIGLYLGMNWSSQGTGLVSILWRNHWEISNDSEYQNNIQKYNSEDCIALILVVDFIRKITDDAAQNITGKIILSADKVKIRSSLKWGKNSFLNPDFDLINKCAYFDYQSSKIYFKNRKLKSNKISERKPICSKKLKPNKIIIHDANIICPHCGGHTYRHGSHSKIITDLKFNKMGVKRWVVKHIGMRRRCQSCRYICLVPAYPTYGSSIGPNLSTYTVYLNIAMRLSFGEIREHIQNVFGIDLGITTLSRIKQQKSQYYKTTVKKLMSSLKKGHLLQVDETNAKLNGIGCYVWVFSNLSEVVYLYAETRKGDLLHRLLKTFQGVLVSDFYAAYDSVPCRQQKCIIHLIRDFNDDLFKNQLNDEFKNLSTEFANLMKKIIETIDKYGLRARHLAKHKKQVRAFFRILKRTHYNSEICQIYQKRLLKNENKLFVFLDYDNIPWNNNYAENAIKTFAEFRKKFNPFFQKNGLKEYLVLLSIQHTCKIRKINFLQFLLSGSKTLPLGKFIEASKN